MNRNVGTHVPFRILYGPDAKLHSVIKNGTVYYYHTNSRGDVLAITDETGEVVARYSYDPWGNILESTGTFANEQPFRYAGYYWDSDLGMYYLINRYYDPSIKRFISKDALANADENAYLYVFNNPVNYNDPSGLRLIQLTPGNNKPSRYHYILQARLNETRNTGLTVNGLFGPATAAAILKWKKEVANWPDDNVADPRLWRALFPNDGGNANPTGSRCTDHNGPWDLNVDISIGVAGSIYDDTWRRAEYVESDCWFSHRRGQNGNISAAPDNYRCLYEAWARNMPIAPLGDSYYEDRSWCKREQLYKDSYPTFPQVCAERLVWPTTYYDRRNNINPEAKTPGYTVGFLVRGLTKNWY